LFNQQEYHQQQVRLLDEVVMLLRQDEQVLGLALAGSWAHGHPDAFSDIDLLCFLCDEQRSGWQLLYEHVKAVAPLLCDLWVYDVHALYLFENGIRLDLDLRKPSEIEQYDLVQHKILYDPKGRLQQGFFPGKRQRVAAHPAYFSPGDPHLLDWFLWMFRQVYGWTKRGAQGGERAFDKLSSAANSLAEVRNTLMQMRLWTLGVQEYLGRCDPACAGRLSNTFPHLLPEELLLCTKRLLAEYEYIGPAYCKKAGIAYPESKVEILKSLLDVFDALE
jgi:hypothetical protein